MGYGVINDFGYMSYMNTIFFIVFAIIVVVIALQLFNGISTWNKNNNSPKLSVVAKVVSKRQDVVVHHRNMNSGVPHNTSSTYYYVTFEVESTDRMELELKGSQYGVIAEGDIGRLTFQGTRYISFERISDTEQ